MLLLHMHTNHILGYVKPKCTPHVRAHRHAFTHVHTHSCVCSLCGLVAARSECFQRIPNTILYIHLLVDKHPPPIIRVSNASFARPQSMQQWAEELAHKRSTVKRQKAKARTNGDFSSKIMSKYLDEVSIDGSVGARGCKCV